MTRAAIPLAAALGSAAAFCYLRQIGGDVSPLTWLAVITAIGVGAIWLARRDGGGAVRVDRVWPEWAALLGSGALAFAREPLPDIFNADLEAAAIVYVTAVVVLFVALRKTILGHRARSPWTIAHAFTCVAAGAATVVVSAAILYLE